MNPQQTNSLLRTVSGTVGGIIIGWFASRGWHLSPDDTKSIMTLLQSPELIGLAMSAITGLIGMVVHTQSNAVAVVKEIAKDPTSPVAGIVTTDNIAGRNLASTMNDPSVIAPAGTVAASTIAKS